MNEINNNLGRRLQQIVKNRTPLTHADAALICKTIDYISELEKGVWTKIVSDQLELSNSRIAKLEAQLKWIPVNELPNENEKVLVRDVYQNYSSATYKHSIGFYDRGSSLSMGIVIEWQPLSELSKSEET